MMKMKKAITIACIVLIVISLIVLAACGKDKNKGKVERTTVPRTTLAGDEETTVEYVVVTDQNGAPVTDSNGEVVTKVPETKEPETDENGQVVTEEPGTTTSSGPNNPTNPNNPTTKNPNNNDPVPQAVKDAIKIFQSGKFYIDGTTYDGKDTAPMRVAVSGDDIYMYTKMEGIEIAILMLDGNTYLINPAKNAYWKPSKLILKQMGMDEFEKPDFGDTTDKSVYISTEEITENGKKLSRHKYDGDEGISNWYTDASGKVVALETFDKSGALISRIDFKEFSGTIPAGLMDNPSGKYKKSSINIFMP